MHSDCTDIGDGVEFRILGPLEVVDRGSPVPVGGPKPRALLAALLLARGAVVSTDRLVSAVWGANPPRDAVGALRAYVSRLRAVLPDGDRLRWRAPGYVLDVADGELDAAEFTRLLGKARERAAAADHRQAADLFDGALALWRGEPLDEFDAADLDPDGHLARLCDLRLAAVQERAEAMLRLGRGRDVVAELETLVARHPDREALAALLMRALYASGRQADALAVYRALRRHLVDELGVEPSDATREVHRQVLEQDPGLAAPSSATDRARPTNLPRRGAALVGRDAAIADLATALRAAPLVTLLGVGGVGKTRLAVEVAARELARFADGAWLCELAPLADGGAVAHAVAAALRVQQRHGATIEADRGRVPRGPVAAARTGQLRARPGRGGAARAQPGGAVPRRRRARHEPGAAGGRGGAGLAGAAAPADRRHRALRPTRAGDPPGLRPAAGAGGLGRGDLSTGRPTAAGDRAGRRADAGDERRRDRPAARRRVRPRPRPAHRAAAAPEPRRGDRMVLPAAVGARAAPLRAPVGVRGRRRPRRRPRGVRRAGAPPRPLRSTWWPRSSTSRWCRSSGTGARARPATGCWRPCAPTGGSAWRRATRSSAGTRELLRRPRRDGRARGAGPRRARLGRGRRCRTPTTCAPRSSIAVGAATPTSPCGWSRRCPRCCRCAAVLRGRRAGPARRST